MFYVFLWSCFATVLTNYRGSSGQAFICLQPVRLVDYRRLLCINTHKLSPNTHQHIDRGLDGRETVEEEKETESKEKNVPIEMEKFLLIL